MGGPAGAFIVPVSDCVMAVGLDGLILATFISGGCPAILGLLRAGTYVRFIPCPVTVGFAAGIAEIICASQFKDLFGQSLPAPEPLHIVAKRDTFWGARGSFPQWWPMVCPEAGIGPTPNFWHKVLRTWARRCLVAFASSVQRGQDRDHAPTSVAGQLICHLPGPYFLGAAARPGALLDQIASHSSALVVYFCDVPFIDSTGTRSFELLARKLHRKGTQLILAGVNAEVRKIMERSGLERVASDRIHVAPRTRLPKQTLPRGASRISESD